MITDIKYKCEHCDASFSKVVECERHEAEAHYHITPEEYYTWKQLYRDVSKFGGLLSRPNDDIDRVKELRLNLDEAIERLSAFTDSHNLCEHPINWC